MKYKIQTNLKVSKKGKIIASFKIEINSWNRILEEFKKILKRILIKILIRLGKKIKSVPDKLVQMRWQKVEI
jgi:hypothetical protein